MANELPRVFVDRIDIEGFKSIRSASIELKPLNVLIGGNGVGKSNFLEYFRMLIASLDARIDGYVNSRGGAWSYLHRGPKVTERIQGAIRLQTEGGPCTLYQNLVFRSPDTLTYDQRHSPTSMRDKSKEVVFEDLCSVVADGAGRPGQLAYFGLKDGIGIYHFHDTSRTGPLRKYAAVNDNVRLDAEGSNLASMLYAYSQRARSEQRNTKFSLAASTYRRIVRLVRKFFPSFHDFVLEPDRPNEERILLRWRQASGDYIYGPHQFSDGTLRAIALATLLEQPANELPNLVLLDEPELGLHPYGIELVVELIRKVSQRAQVVVATQSPLFLDFFTPEEIIVVDADLESSQFRRLKHEELQAWLQDYTLSELWQKNVFGGGPLA
ncbi:MAG: AAA family ATPase [Gemmataceae bacterium]|nr:AAA family ATPase [Gemmataceae bacterium]